MALDRRQTSWLLIFGGGLFAALFTLFSLGMGGVLPSLHDFFEEHHWFAHLAEAVAMGPLAIGIAGLLTLTRDRIGRLGHIALIVASLGIGLEALAGLVIAIFEPTTTIDFQSGAAMALTHAPGVIGNFVGGVLFAIALLRSDVLPRHSTVPFAALAIGAILLNLTPLGEAGRLALPAVAALAWAWLGVALLIPQSRTEAPLGSGAVVR